MFLCGLNCTTGFNSLIVWKFNSFMVDWMQVICNSLLKKSTSDNAACVFFLLFYIELCPEGQQDSNLQLTSHYEVTHTYDIVFYFKSTISSCTPGRIRTYDSRFKRPVLCPTELREYFG